MVSTPVSKFSIYPNNRVRILAHIILWILIFLFFISISRSLFGENIFSLPILLYGILVVSVTICNHYFLSYYTLPKLINRKWKTVLLHFLLIYIFSAALTILPLNWFANHFSSNQYFKLRSEKYIISGFLDFFTYSIFIWVYTVVFFNNLMTFALKIAKNYYETSKESVLIMKERNDIELTFLRAQIQPHFLFNTLNNIYGLVIDNQKAKTSILKLSDLLRFSLYGSQEDSIMLKEEVKFLTDYIDLEQIRHKDGRVSIEFDFNGIEKEDVKIKPLVLVNFIENAFKHGINSSSSASWVKIVLEQNENIIIFKVSNNIGNVKSKNQKQQGGVGLKNVRRRLDLEYPSRYDLSIKKTHEKFEVVLTLKVN